jgi:hypothetical protein
MKTTFLLAGFAALILSLAGLFFDSKAFMTAYLESFLLFLGLTLGALGIWILHSLTGGRWGEGINNVVRATAKTLPLSAMFFVPLGFFSFRLFPWADKEYLRSNPALLQKIWYLNPPFFLGRALFYFCIWLFALRGINRRSQFWINAGAFFIFITVSFAAFDWIMSLQPLYYSTVFGALVAMTVFMGAFAFCIFITVGRPNSLSTSQLNDLSSLLFMAIAFWAYLEFCQYLIQWSGQMKTEVSFYNARFTGGWQWWAAILLVFNFLIPFFLLLFRNIKENARALFWLTACLLLMQWVNIIWLVGPALSPMKMQFHLLDVLLPVALGGFWINLVYRNIEKELVREAGF